MLNNFLFKFFFPTENQIEKNSSITKPFFLSFISLGNQKKIWLKSKNSFFWHFRKTCNSFFLFWYLVNIFVLSQKFFLFLQFFFYFLKNFFIQQVAMRKTKHDCEFISTHFRLHSRDSTRISSLTFHTKFREIIFMSETFTIPASFTKICSPLMGHFPRQLRSVVFQFYEIPSLSLSLSLFPKKTKFINYLPFFIFLF